MKYDNEWDMEQMKKSKHKSNTFFSVRVLVISGSSFHTDVQFVVNILR